MKVILFLSGLGIVALLAELFRFKKYLYPIILIGILGSIAIALSYWYYDDGSLTPYLNGMVDNNHHIPSAAEMASNHIFSSMIQFGDSSMLLSIIILSTAFLWFVMSKDFFDNDSSKTDHYSLIIFSLVGAIILVCYANMVMLFLGIEILSIPLYVLAGSRKNDLHSNEASFKYFLMGSFASGFLLFGIALIYGASASFDLPTIGAFIHNNVENLPGFFYAGIVMLLVGLLFKISAVPFHFWAPDVYEGSPTVITAFMSTIVKTAAVVAIMRLFLSPVFADVDSFWGPIIAVCTGLTFVIGNVTAAVQEKAKRMLAYSSISHAGFLLLAVVAFYRLNGETNHITFAAKTIIYYVAAYSAASIAAFTVLLNIMEQIGNDKIESFNGLAKKNPLLAVVMTIALFSLAGIPPTAGFFGKYYVFNAALQTGHYWLVIIGILGSLVGVYYYFKIIIAMFFKESNNDIPIHVSGQHQALLFVTAVIILVLGLVPDLLLNAATYAPLPPGVVQVGFAH